GADGGEAGAAGAGASFADPSGGWVDALRAPGRARLARARRAASGSRAVEGSITDSSPMAHLRSGSVGSLRAAAFVPARPSHPARQPSSGPNGASTLISEDLRRANPARQRAGTAETLPVDLLR